MPQRCSKHPGAGHQLRSLMPMPTISFTCVYFTTIKEIAEGTFRKEVA